MSSLIILGPSGVGKGTIIKRLVQRNKLFQFTLSFTTRSRREGQIDGKDYHFINYEQYLGKVSNNEVLESKKVFQNYYGTSKQSFYGILSRNKIPLLDIDVEGMKDITAKVGHPGEKTVNGRPVHKPLVLCIMPPSIRVLEERLMGRNTEKGEVLKNRLQQNRAQIQEIEQLRDPNIYFVTNYQYQLTVCGIQKWLASTIQTAEYLRRQCS